MGLLGALRPLVAINTNVVSDEKIVRLISCILPTICLSAVHEDDQWVVFRTGILLQN